LRNPVPPRLLFPLFDSLAITQALSTAFFPACACRPITLLRLPSRPSPRRLPARLAAVALARLQWQKSPFATLQQTGAGPRTAGGAFPPAVFPFFGRTCRILDRAHGSAAPGKLMPWRGLASSPGRSRSGSVQPQNSIADGTGARRSLSFLSPPRARRLPQSPSRRLASPL
jgi:hypothetical protein